MIWILSSLEDRSTNDVINWIEYFGNKFIRTSIDDQIFIESIYFTSNNFDIKFSINNISYKLSEIKRFWYRRSEFNFKFPNRDTNMFSNSIQINKKILKHLNYEQNELIRFFISELERKFRKVF